MPFLPNVSILFISISHAAAFCKRFRGAGKVEKRRAGPRPCHPGNPAPGGPVKGKALREGSRLAFSVSPNFSVFLPKGIMV
ncbi:MAG TPA: hypothetical protein DC013_08155 [Ruminococcaceae bacterium]|nr:hypothetical protein [Oscillospiraceae bacterium]